VPRIGLGESGAMVAGARNAALIAAAAVMRWMRFMIGLLHLASMCT
jgi:hypothetical protein